MADVPEILVKNSAGAGEEHSAGVTPQKNDQLLFLTRLRARTDFFNINLPKVEIKFDKLSVEAQTQKPRRALPTLWNSTLNFIEDILTIYTRIFPHKRMTEKILDDLSGIIRPSRMVLILGRPGSGKTTLLRALAGKLEPGLDVQGSVTYNGLDVNGSISKQLSAYVSQHDLHQGELTVSETLNFSHRLFGCSTISEILDEISRREEAIGTGPDPVIDKFVKDAKVNGRYVVTDYMTEVLGLSTCAHVTVGDKMRRGISGGEMKRVSIGEMLVGPARAFFMDEISNGLDSSTVLKIVNFLKEMAHLLNVTVVVTLLQPSSEIFDLFDDLILLCEGRILYHGPREKVLDFFQFMGFKCPARKNVPDFLSEVTSGMHQLQYRPHMNQHFKFVTNQDFCDSFKSYSISRLLSAESQQTTASQSEALVLSSKSMNKTKWNMFKASLSRELLLLKRNSPARAFKVIQILLIAFIVTATFSRGKERMPLEEDLIRLLGAIYAGVVVLMFNGMVELTMMILRLPVYYKQRDLQCYPGWAFLLPEALLHIPVTMFESAIWVSVTYFPIGFAHSPTRFFKVLLTCCCIQESSVALTRFIAAISRTQVMANIIGTAILVAVFVLGGFVISKDDIPPWWIWGFWICPATYAQNALAVNEFLDKRWSMPTAFSGIDRDEIGKAFLKSKGMFSEPYSFWICIGALCGFCILFNIQCAIALSYLGAPHKAHVNFATNLLHGSIQIHALISTTSPSLCLENGTMSRHMALSVQHLTLAFQHINYYVDMPAAMKKYNPEKKRLQLLKDASGVFKAGSLTALMGETGAGKTTLMDVLAGRKTGGYIEGSITIAGYLKKQETFTRVFGYCEQNDIHSPYITVDESLLFSAWLRLPSEIITQTRNMFVDEVMELVELKELKGSLVGIPGMSGLTTDQRRRLSMAVELVSNPSIIFMDEPTSGLDTPAAAIVMKAIRQTADTGRTVVCTIHQPNLETFEAFDQLLLMKRGELIYSGPVGSSGQNIIRYLEGIPGVPKMQNGCNPSTWMLDVTSTNMDFGRGTDFSDYYLHSSLYEETVQQIEELSKPLPGSRELAFTSKYAQSFKTQCAACCLKQIWSYWRNPELNLHRIIITISIALLFGTMFWNIGYKLQEEQDLFNMLGVLYVSALYLGFVNCALVQPIVWFEKTVFNRERSAGMYSAMPYAIAQVAAEIPYIIVQVIIFTFIVYSMVGLQWTIIKFAWFISFIFLGFIYFSLLGMMLVSCTPSLEIAAALSFFFFVLWNLFSGFFIPRRMMRSWTKWYYWLDPAAWTVYGLMVSQLRDRPEIVHMFVLPDQTARDFMESFLGFRVNLLLPILTLHLAAIFVFLFVFASSIKYLNFQKR